MLVSTGQQHWRARGGRNQQHPELVVRRGRRQTIGIESNHLPACVIEQRNSRRHRYALPCRGGIHYMIEGAICRDPKVLPLITFLSRVIVVNPDRRIDGSPKCVADVAGP